MFMFILVVKAPKSLLMTGPKQGRVTISFLAGLLALSRANEPSGAANSKPVMLEFLLRQRIPLRLDSFNFRI